MKNHPVVELHNQCVNSFLERQSNNTQSFNKINDDLVTPLAQFYSHIVHQTPLVSFHILPSPQDIETCSFMRSCKDSEVVFKYLLTEVEIICALYKLGITINRMDIHDICNLIDIYTDKPLIFLEKSQCKAQIKICLSTRLLRPTCGELTKLQVNMVRSMFLTVKFWEVLVNNALKHPNFHDPVPQSQYDYIVRMAELFRGRYLDNHIDDSTFYQQNPDLEYSVKQYRRIGQGSAAFALPELVMC